MISDNSICEIKHMLRDVVKATTKESKGGFYVCPFCGSGTGTNKTGALRLKNENVWHCFACGRGGDVFDYVGELYSIPESDFRARVKKAAEICGVHLDDADEDAAPIGFDDPVIGPFLRAHAPAGYVDSVTGETAPGATQDSKPATQTQDKPAAQDAAKPTPTVQAAAAQPTKGDGATMTRTTKQTQDKEPPRDFTAFEKQAARNLMDLSEDDFSRIARGISRDTCGIYGVGYMPSWKHPNAPAFLKGTPRLIIPTSNTSYIARDVRPESELKTENDKRYKKQKAGEAHFFNVGALWTAAQPIYITEGEIDALSILDAGGAAVGLGSVDMIPRFMKMLDGATALKQRLIIALDNDTAGKEAAKKLAAHCKQAEIPFLLADPAQLYDGAKDANEALQLDRDGLRARILATAQAARENAQPALITLDSGDVIDKDAADAEARRKELDAEFSAVSAGGAMQGFINHIRESGGTPCVSSGFPMLDKRLDGGIYPGLYSIGAVSSLGKTTFVMQIADSIAKAEHDVLIFSLEMSRFELMAKSISRHTAEIVRREGLPTSWQKTARGIMAGHRYGRYERGEVELIERASREYNEYANHIYIYEGVGDIGAVQIANTVKNFIEWRGHAPVVIVDYMQLLAPYDVRSTDKQNTDKSVLELKRLSRDEKTPVICISSFNRQNYAESANMTAFKESGAIEYTSDVLIALQFSAVHEKASAKANKNYDEQREKRKEARDIELVLLKSRYSRAGVKLFYNFISAINLWEELPEAMQPDENDALYYNPGKNIADDDGADDRAQDAADDPAGVDDAAAAAARAMQGGKKRKADKGKKRTAQESTPGDADTAEADAGTQGAVFPSLEADASTAADGEAE